MKHTSHEEAIDRVFKYLSELSDDEFEKTLDRHADGDFAAILRDTGALTARGEETQVVGTKVPITDTRSALASQPTYQDIASPPTFIVSASPAVVFARHPSATVNFGLLIDVQSEIGSRTTNARSTYAGWTDGTLLVWSSLAATLGSSFPILQHDSLAWRSCLDDGAEGEGDCAWAAAA